LVSLADGARLVVKIPPASGTPLLRYERQGILATEALYYQLAGECRDVTVADVVAVDTVDAAGGYPSGSVGPLRETWRAAFLDMVKAVLADAETFAVTLPRPIADILEWFNARAGTLDEVATPVLVHFDLWDGNILVEAGPGRPRIGALIDAERAFWGDPLAEFVSLALYRDIEQDTAVLAGWRARPGVRPRTPRPDPWPGVPAARHRLGRRVAPDLPPGARTH
jgi:aminoglycoside phosphotransferase (APT) family kinase protein